MNTRNFYEIFAKISLQNVFPDEFSNLTLSDRPDLIDDTRKLGIEVTYATNEKEERLNAYYQDSLFGKRIEQISSKGLSVFRKNKYDIVFDGETHTVSAYKKEYEPFDINIVYEAIERKFLKLNSGLYKYPDNTSLYLEMSKYSYEFADMSVAEKILYYANELKLKNTFAFKEIFYDCIFVMYRCNLLNGTIEKIDLENICDKILNDYEEFIETANQN